MKKILYIGNKLEKWGRTPTAVDLIPGLLKKEGLQVVSVSNQSKKYFRLLEMCLHCLIGNYQKIVIDTYSTQNFIYAKLCGSISRFRGIDYYFILHGGQLDRKIESSGMYVKKLFQNASRLVAPSSFLLGKFSKYDFNNLILIPNTVTLQDYPYHRRDQLKPQFFWLRSFQQLYNPKMAIDVFERVLKNYPEAELCMAGPDKDGSLEELKSYVAQHKLKVHFPGKLSKSQFMDLSRKYSIFLNTSCIDNTPVSVIEAMALGLPVVSTNVGGMPLLITSEITGILVGPDDAEVMAQACLRLLEDPTLADNLAKNARLEAESYSWDRVKHQWLDLLS